MGTDRKTEEAHKKSLGVSIDAGGDNGMNPERGNGVFYYLLSVHYIKFFAEHFKYHKNMLMRSIFVQQLRDCQQHLMLLS